MSDGPQSAGFTQALARGIAAVDEWCADGTLVGASEVERKRGAAVRELESDSLVAYKHRGEIRYLACVLELPPAEVARVNRRLAGLPSSEKVLFWLNAHGALRGLRPDQALRAGRVERVAAHAQAWAADRGSKVRTRRIKSVRKKSLIGRMQSPYDPARMANVCFVAVA